MSIGRADCAAGRRGGFADVMWVGASRRLRATARPLFVGEALLDPLEVGFRDFEERFDDLRVELRP